MGEKIGVIGLGYVGLPLAIALAEKFPDTVGFDLNSERVEAINKGEDPTNEGLAPRIAASKLKASREPEILKGVTFFVIGVPTPVDQNNTPDLTPLVKACGSVGRAIQPGAVVVFESTVYPGVTEDICGPEIERVSGLKRGRDFFLGYSPERINPGDKEHTLETVVKIVSAEDEKTLKRVVAVYSQIIRAGLYQAGSIKEAEAAKVIENTQRDLNIALMNELAIIFDKIGLSTKKVLQAASTKWNFLKFSPGLVGGHCIGVDPYYLTTKAEQLGYHPEVILAGRRINDGMGRFVAQRTVKLMINAGMQLKGARVGIFGLTFKENVSDIRNSRVPDIISELRQFGIEPLIYDPHVSAEEAFDEYQIKISNYDELNLLDALIVAVAHTAFKEQGSSYITRGLKKAGVFVDVKALFAEEDFGNAYHYWSL
jgi:UDP-N-acetyl-D-galactosamine dehydrogenase